MASVLSHRLFCIQSLRHQFQCLCYSSNQPTKSSLLFQNSNCSVRLRTVPKSSPRDSPTTPQKPITPIEIPDPNPSSDSSSLNLASPLLRRLRDGFKVDALGLEILSIALPAALALAADPIASLVDTAFVGHLGSVELAAIGVSVSVVNLVSKLFNVPLLNVTTSFVAEEQALVAKSDDESNQVYQDFAADHQSKIFLPSVSTSLALAAGIGIAEAVALSVGSGFANAYTS
ncbi:hypothetical protein CsSME_00017628 [Camellia sinensis var. sinensis]